MNVTEAMTAYLNRSPYDGLYAPDGSCPGCLTDYLAPCGQFPGTCQAGYMIDAPEHDENDFYVSHDPHAEPWLREEK